jgi:hypothetical protein
MPTNVRRFAWLYWASALIAIIGVLPLSTESWTARDVAAFQLVAATGVTVLFAAIFLPIFWFAVWRRQNWARCLLLLAFVASVPFTFLPPSETRFPPAIAGVGILSNLVEACAFYFLFTGDARPWFNRTVPASGIREANRFGVVAFSTAAMIWVAIPYGIFYQSSRPEFVAALQQRCNRQAERVVAGSGWKQSDDPVNGIVESYRDHYNARLSRCFILFKSIITDMTTRDTRKSYSLRDAFEQATYAEYFESDLPGFNPLVSTCSLTMPNEEPVVCHSSEEWNRLVKPYIEIGPQ